jgi:hypothetical protein
MAQVKLPQITVVLKKTYDNVYKKNEKEFQWTQVNPSCLLAYLGIRGFANLQNVETKTATKNAVPILAYYDIFKNFYANTQEDNFYIIGGTPELTVGYNGNPVDAKNMNITLKNNDIFTFDNLVSQNGLIIYGSENSRYREWKATDIGTWKSKTELLIDKINSKSTYIVSKMAQQGTTALQQIPLENLDTIRDKILLTPGDIVFDIGSKISSVAPFNTLTERFSNNKLKTSAPQFGLCLKTYNSDLYQNWINTEWIEGVDGINEASAVDVSDGTLSMDALNLSQKVYNFLNRIAISGGTYRDWLETVYTGGNYMERCETPMFEGGVSQEIVFQEVISNSASENEPLGTLAGRGVTTGRQKGGHIRIKVTEPCYIISICSITPRIDYGQGNTWDTYLETMDDWHKPALDGIGYQDSINGERAWWADYYTADPDLKRTAAGKTVAWINYMTNVNRTFGNFAPGMSESFMVLNRNYSMNNSASPQIEDLTTYIDPEKFNYIFADANLDAMNFWVQTRFEIKARRLISAKQIPNL